MNNEWKEWIKINLERGSNKDEMFNILKQNGFSIPEIIQYLKYPHLLNTSSTVQNYKLLNNLFFANAKKVHTNKINLYVIDNFINSNTCKYLCKIISKYNKPSNITTQDTEPDKYFRTSKTCNLPQSDKNVQALEEQISNYLGINIDYAETSQGQLYNEGDQFKAHTDWFTPNTEEFKQYAGTLGQRTWTFMIYLNDVENGGTTEFTHLGINIKPKEGKAIFWNNIDSNGEVIENTKHWAKPPTSGRKFVITKWFREFRYDRSPYIPKVRNYIPNYTKYGYSKQKLSDKLFNKILKFYTENKSLISSNENGWHSLQKYVYNKSKTPTTQFLDLANDPGVEQMLKSELLGILEKWANISLEWTSIYGIRIYQNGSILNMHTDRYDTHVISFIINVDQDINDDWPLVLIDNFGIKQEIILKPGDIVLYESARCSHGRPYEFNGKSFANIFGHSKPYNYDKLSNSLTTMINNKLINRE